MKTIYICEDNEQQLQHIKHIVEDYISFHREGLPLQIAAFTTPYELLNAVQRQSSIGLYLLDVDLQSNQTGIEMAKKLRKLDPRGFIVFITTHDELLPLTFKHRVEALDYISKKDSDFRTQVFQALDSAFARYDAFHKAEAPTMPLKVKIRVGSTIHYINGYDIVCAKVTKYQHRVQLYTSEGIIEYYGTLSELKKELPTEQFYQCHRSAIINLDFLSFMDAKEYRVHMLTGITVPISSRKVEGLKKYLASI